MASEALPDITSVVNYCHHGDFSPVAVYIFDHAPWLYPVTPQKPWVNLYLFLFFDKQFLQTQQLHVSHANVYIHYMVILQLMILVLLYYRCGEGTYFMVLHDRAAKAWLIVRSAVPAWFKGAWLPK